MRQQTEVPVTWNDCVGVFALLLLAVFATELAIMELFSPLFERLGLIGGGAADAVGVTLVCALPLWFFLFRLTHPDSPLKRWSLLFKALLSVFLVEFLVMLLLPVLCRGLDGFAIDLVDALLTMLLIAYPLWRLLFSPELRRHIVPIMDTPLRLYLLLLGSIFFSDLLEEMIMPAHWHDPIANSYVLDAFLTTLCGAPLIWLLVARPLKQAAKRERERGAALYNQVIEAIVVTTPQGLVSSFNPAAERIFGWGLDEMLGQSAERLFEGGSQVMLELMRHLEERNASQLAISEVTCRCRDGRLLTMNISVSELRLGPVAEYLFILRDITRRIRMEQALRDSETRFKEIFHQSEDALIFLKPGSCQVLDANAKAETVFGYSRAELQDGGFAALCASAQPPILAPALAEIGAAGGLTRMDLSCRTKEGQEIVISVRGKTMMLQGTPVTYCSFRDVTERMHLEERARELQAKLIQTNKMTSLGLLVSGVAHEINNPNSYIMANCELLSRISGDTLKALDEFVPEPLQGELFLGGVPFAEVDATTRRLLSGIGTGSQRINEIVRDLKGFARQEANQPKRPLDLNQVASAAVSLMQHELIKFTNRFQMALAPELPQFPGHGQQLGQVIINLLMNACQALPGKDKGVELSTGWDPERAELWIRVSDEGRGITPEQGQRILEPFFTTKYESGGTGLGLSISETIIKDHDGRLEFTSTPGQGSCFEVRLPLPDAVKESVS